MSLSNLKLIKEQHAPVYAVIYEPNGKKLGRIMLNEVGDWVYWSDTEGFSTQELHRFLADKLEELNDTIN
ncbi:MAG: hypothetical protein F6K48_03330 [Okeania sp. SIO3H1]|nr:hypothetical protein [Okeania sp. SIO3H1]